jgi:predicted MPP superfamily phosphohydrolase
VLKNYLDYFLRRKRIGTRRNPTERLRAGLLDEGWTDLTNLTLFAEIGQMRWQITGLDDPYLRREDRSLLVRSSSAEFALCVVHDPAPYADIARAGFDLVVSGHTHGGQVRLPFLGAVVTNSELPRRYARGLHRIDRTWLFVSPGLGTGKYAPFRFLCPPEASILELSTTPGE